MSLALVAHEHANEALKFALSTLQVFNLLLKATKFDVQLLLFCQFLILLLFLQFCEFRLG